MNPRPGASPAVTRFGRRVAAERNRRGWTLAEVSAKSGVGVTIIGNLERGSQGCVLDSAIPLAAALEISLDGLTGPCDRCGDNPPAGYACRTCGAEGAVPQP